MPYHIPASPSQTRVWESSVISSFLLWVMTHFVLQIPEGETSLPETLVPKGEEEKGGTFFPAASPLFSFSVMLKE